MKKFCLGFILFSILLSSAFASEFNITKDKELRNAFEFCELYTDRINDLEDRTGISIEDFSFYTVFDNVFGDDTAYDINCKAGNLYVNKTDLTVREAYFAFHDLNADAEKNSSLAYATMIAISALELDSLDNSTMELSYPYGLSDSSDAIDWALNLYDDKVSKKFENPHILHQLQNGQKIRVYLGKYAYDLTYQDFMSNGRRCQHYYLIANSTWY